MKLEIAPLWTPTSYGKEHISAYQILAIDIIQTVDQLGVYKTEREAHNARNQILRALMRDDPETS